ncbi:unnamed protein product [Calicophoron daubneyi]|uniref:Heat shock protein 70 n=1 Tax=Calicophoron daubneyi TaxID=300641 RepID=A0AAV2TCK9_CALDB
MLIMADERAFKPSFGIDLGTKYSCLARRSIDGKIENIASETGEYTTPSVVVFTEEETCVGKPAVDVMELFIKSTVYDVKRLIGRRFLDPTVQEDRKHWPFEVIEDKGMIKVQVDVNGTKESYYPEEIAAKILEKFKERMKEVNEGEDVEDVVITVPAHFNIGQRESTIAAAKLAGLNVLRLISEPTAAALAYQSEFSSDEEKNLLVYDLGGGTFDVSVLKVKDRTYMVKATTGDTHLGGADFDRAIAKHFEEELKKNHPDLNLTPEAKQRILTACEQAKRNLSQAVLTKVDVDVMESSSTLQITRAKFEELNKDLFNRTLVLVDQALNDAGMSKDKIDEIILVGGSTRVPMIQQLLSTHFAGKRLNMTVNPDEAVAYGAAVLAGEICNENIGSKHFSEKEFALKETVPLSIGAMGENGLMKILIKRNTPIPAIKQITVTTTADDQKVLLFRIHQGEMEKAAENFYLGQFELDGLQGRKAKEATVVLRFSVDENGVLKASAKDLRTGRKKGIDLAGRSGLTEQQITEMIVKSGDKRKQELQQSRTDFALFRSKIISKLALLEKEKRGSKENFKGVSEKLEEVDKWIELHPGAQSNEITLKRMELEEVCKIENLTL